MTLPVRLADLLVPSQHTPVDQTFFNKRFTLLFNGLDNVDQRMSVYDAQVANLVEVGLDRLNTALGPMLVTLQAAAQLGFLQCESIGTNISLVVGEAEGFHVTAGADLFTPTPFLAVQDKNDETNWGIVSLDAGGWTKTTGDLATHCLYASKTQTSNSWVISASAGILPAMQNLLSQTQTAATNAANAEAAIAADIVTLNALIAAVASGPVASVAGRTGVVTLSTSDIVGLTTALSNKLDTSAYAAGVAGKQDASAKLSSLAAMTWAANKLLLTTSPTTVTGLDISAYMQGVLASANAAAASAAIHSAKIQAIDGVTWAANQLLLLTGASTVSAVTISPTVQALLGSSSNAAFLAAIGGVDSTGLPPKATSADLIAGTDNTKYVSSSVLPSVYAQRTFDVAANQGSGFTLGAAFNGQVIPWTNASAGTITLDPAAPKGTEALISCEGAGQITFAAGSGATVQSRGARLKSNGQYSQITAYVISNAGSAAAWRLGGDLTT